MLVRQAEYFKLFIINVYQITVFVVKFDACRKILIDVSQYLLAVVQSKTFFFGL